MNNLNSQRGLSLIELMIALVISSFLIIGVTQIYIDNKRSYVFQQNQSENQEGGRYALMVLQQELAKAGYRRQPDESATSAFPAVTAADCSMAAGQSVKRTSLNSVCIRYQLRDANDRDCQGDLPNDTANLATPYTKATEIVVERLYLENGNLMCKSSHTNVAGSTVGTAKSAELVSGVVDLRFEAGVGSATDARTLAQYTKSITTDPIVAIRYTALMKSSGRNLRDAVDVTTALTNWKSIVGATTAEEKVISDADTGQLYQITQAAVMLRNLMP